MDLYHQFLDYEANFQGQDAINFTRNHCEIPVFAVGVYLMFIFYFPKMQEWGILPTIQLKLQTLFAGWNMLLSCFSIFGATRVVPYLFHELTDPAYGATFSDRYLNTVCGEAKSRYVNGPVGLWTLLFIYSKFPELLDTAFLVVQKKKVIFLHWFHHTTVLMYCWHAYHNSVSQGIWFAAMNLSVHAIMYFYYFMGAINLRKVVRPFAPLITTIQILQMVGGIAVTVTAALHHDVSDATACATDAANWKMGLGKLIGCFFVVIVFSIVLLFFFFFRSWIRCWLCICCVDSLLTVVTFFSGFCCCACFFWQECIQCIVDCLLFCLPICIVRKGTSTKVNVVLKHRPIEKQQLLLPRNSNVRRGGWLQRRVPRGCLVRRTIQLWMWVMPLVCFTGIKITNRNRMRRKVVVVVVRRTT